MIDSFEIFPWQDNYSVGILQIDEQHQKLVLLINRLACGLAIQANALGLKSIFKELVQYAMHHFQSEERVWRQYFAEDDWEDTHKKLHENFLSEVRKLQELENSKPYHELVEEILSFLTHWLIVHILDSDKRMSIVVHAIQSGLSVEQAKNLSNQEMSQVAENMLETVLAMSDILTGRTLELIKETMESQRLNAERFLASKTLEINLKAKGITEREREIMALVVAGFSSKEIALRLAISFRTVEAHRSTIKHKTGASNLLELARIRKD